MTLSTRFGLPLFLKGLDYSGSTSNSLPGFYEIVGKDSALMIFAAFLPGLFLAFSNGANDNFKGVATLLGSKTTTYRVALLWATVTTFAGSLAAFFLAQKLMLNFSGKGLVPDQVIGLGSFSAAVSLSSALTVFLATRLGFPISTTHAITGALVGAGLVASAGAVNLQILASVLFLPLLISPVIAVLGTAALYPTMSFLRRRLGVTRESCICVGSEIILPVASLAAGMNAAAFQIERRPLISVGTTATCEQRYFGRVMGLSAKTVIDTSHFLSSGLVSFARGLNDTPKIAAILLAGSVIHPLFAMVLVAVTMALGGLLLARRIADTMSYQITEMNDGQGLSANLVTGLVVLGASQLGVPVSTTHVSCGSLFGIGAVSGSAHWGSIIKIVLAWVVTLPVAGVLGFGIFSILKGVL